MMPKGCVKMFSHQDILWKNIILEVAGISSNLRGTFSPLYSLVDLWVQINADVWFMNRSRPLCTLQIGVDF